MNIVRWFILFLSVGVLFGAEYPEDLSKDISLKGTACKVRFGFEINGNSANDVVCAFEYARSQDPTVREKHLSLPAEWESLDYAQKGLYLLNAERSARGLDPLEGCDRSVMEVAQKYTELLASKRLFSHSADGDPWQRMDRDPRIQGCKDFMPFGENLYNATSRQDPSTAIVSALFNWIYKDAASSWGHRHFALYSDYVDNALKPHQEGLIGIGIAYSTTGGTYVVIDGFDPCEIWQLDPHYSLMDPSVSVR